MKITYNRSRLILMLSMIFLVAFITLDIFEDYEEGATITHLSIELAMLVISGIAFIIILKEYIQEKNQRIELQISVDRLAAEHKTLKQASRQYLKGLSSIIDQQFKGWRLTTSEQQVGFLLLKGLSLKEIAQIRGASEKTVHTQTQAIYKKSRIHGRSEFSAYFLEDLLPPGNFQIQPLQKEDLF